MTIEQQLINNMNYDGTMTPLEREVPNAPEQWTGLKFVDDTDYGDQDLEYGDDGYSIDEKYGGRDVNIAIEEHAARQRMKAEYREKKRIELAAYTAYLKSIESNPNLVENLYNIPGLDYEYNTKSGLALDALDWFNTKLYDAMDYGLSWRGEGMKSFYGEGGTGRFPGLLPLIYKNWDKIVETFTSDTPGDPDPRIIHEPSGMGVEKGSRGSTPMPILPDGRPMIDTRPRQ